MTKDHHPTQSKDNIRSPAKMPKTTCLKQYVLLHKKTVDHFSGPSPQSRVDATRLFRDENKQQP